MSRQSLASTRSKREIKEGDSEGEKDESENQSPTLTLFE